MSRMCDVLSVPGLWSLFKPRVLMVIFYTCRRLLISPAQFSIPWECRKKVSMYCSGSPTIYVKRFMTISSVRLRERLTNIRTNIVITY